MPILAALVLAGQLAWPKTVGIWKDGRSYIRDGMLKTLQEAGWETVILAGADMSDEAKLAALDVIFLPAGWNAYYFADFNARRSLAKFVAGGKGILAGAFRSGYVRTANRPFFPEVGLAHNRVNSPYILAYGDSELAKAIDQPFCPGGWDHIVVKVGPKGKVFAVSGDDPVGVYGEVYGGRYVVFGAFIGIDAKTEVMQGTGRRVLLAMLDWLDAAPKLDEAKRAEHTARADLDLLRREKLYDWAANERGPDRSGGLVPQRRNLIAAALESRLYTLQYMSPHLSFWKRRKCRSQAEKLGQAVDELDQKFASEMAAVKANIAGMTIDELLAEHPVVQNASVQQKVAAAPGKTEAESKAMAALVKRCTSKRPPVYAAKNVAIYLHGEEISQTLFPQARLQKLVAGADKVIAALRPAVRTAKAKAAASELKADRATVPALIQACSAADVAARREAAVELGRIGGPQGVPALIAMLKDADERAAIAAITSLGWIQSRDAVPALIGMAAAAPMPVRRRVAQALGQIGDPRAVEALLANIGEDDFYVAENAILALGWLKAKAAVVPLLAIVTGSDRTDRRQRGLMLAAARALGHIGDSAALPALQKLAAEADDFPSSRRRASRPITNIYSTAQSLGLKGHADLAIAEIKAGGRQEIGIRQRPFLARRDKFYGLTRRFNALAGRTSSLRYSNFKDDPSGLWPYLWEAGLTGVHQAWGEQDADPDEYFAQVKAASEFDLLWIDILPTGGNQFGAKRTASKYGPHGVGKPGAEVVLLRYQDVPAFHGFWSEETYPDQNIPGKEFEAWLVRRHGADFRQKLGVPADFDVAGTKWITWGKEAYPEPLKVEFLHCCAEKLLGAWRESQEWLGGLRQGCAFTYSVSTAQPVRYPGVTARVGGIIDANGPESYQGFGRFNAFFMEMHKDGEARPAMSEFYNWYSPSPAHDIRGFAQHLMHGECFYNFAIHHIFGQASRYDMWSWDATRWDAAKRIFQKARKTRQYLTVPASAANVALLCSDLTPLVFAPLNNYGASLYPRWIQHQSAMWTALNQSQVPTDVIWTETLTPEKLRRYRVIVLADAKIVTAEQAQMLRDWVRAGGALIASGTTSLFDRWGTQQKDYALADLFGVTYAANGGPTDPDKIDTYCWKQRGPTTFKAAAGLTPDLFSSHVHRDIKPVKSLQKYTISAAAGQFLPGVAAAAECEYDMPLGYDRAKAGSVTVLAQFANGDPALTVNKVGKGLCYFWTPIYPGLCHVSSAWEMQPNQLDFWPNVRELLTAMVAGGLSHQGATLPVEVLDVPTAVEVTLRRQAEHNRWMVHLLNYDTEVDLVAAPKLLVHPPAGRQVKRLFYPDGETELESKSAEHGVTAKMRDFDVHDMLVIEWELAP